jgi:hypothetical protein
MVRGAMRLMAGSGGEPVACGTRGGAAGLRWRAGTRPTRADQNTIHTTKTKHSKITPPTAGNPSLSASISQGIRTRSLLTATFNLAFGFGFRLSVIEVFSPLPLPIDSVFRMLLYHLI